MRTEISARVASGRDEHFEIARRLRVKYGSERSLRTLDVLQLSVAVEPRVMSDAKSIAGEGPVEGFALPLEGIWAGL